MQLTNVKTSVLREIILMSLTYRLSYENVAKMFHTDALDVQEAFELLDFHRSVYYLNEETKNEDKTISEYAYKNALLYWKQRQKLIKEYNQFYKEQNKEKLEEKKTEIKRHQSLIDDSIVRQTIGKKRNLTQEEKDSLARYRLKYYIPLTEAKEVLQRDKDTIKRYEEDLASRDIIFKKKLDTLNYEYTYRGKKYLEIKAKGR